MRYEPVIGMEVHVELMTATKVFCGCSIDFGAAPNRQTCPVCLGMPGSLPTLNKRAVEFTLRAAIALNCSVTRECQFERKNYYYPDLPKNYQISQLRSNLGVGGWIDIPVEGGVKRIGIHNVHLEEDAGKLVHPEFQNVDYSLVDLNRAGTALMEIVSDPDLRSVEEARSYMQTLKNVLQYIEVSDCNMHEGRLRFECNISVRPEGESELRTKVEIKNLNSIRTAMRTIEYEIKRQSKVYDEGGRIYQETRLWDDVEGVTRTMRSKEEAHDYRYFPEPDLPWVEIGDAWLAEVKSGQPELREAKRARFEAAFGLPEYDAALITESKSLADYYEIAVKRHNNPKSLSNWIMTEVLRELNHRGLEVEDCPIKPEQLADMVKMIDDSTISGKIAKTVFADMIESGKDPAAIVQEKGLVQVTDSGEIEAWVDAAIESSPKAAQEYREGKDKAMASLVGAVMKQSKGKANPGLVNELLNKKLR